MIAGSGNHNVFICDECIELCSEILEEELGKQEEEEVKVEIPEAEEIGTSMGDLLKNFNL